MDCFKFYQLESYDQYGFNSLLWEYPKGESDANRFRRKLYFPFFDRMLIELKKQFIDAVN